MAQYRLWELLDSVFLPSKWGVRKSLVAKSLKLWILLPKTFTHTEPKVLLDGQKRVGKTAGLPEDMVVRSLIAFEHPVQVESQYMAEEAALICRLQRRLVCWCHPGTIPRVVEMPPIHISSQTSMGQARTFVSCKDSVFLKILMSMISSLAC